MDSTSDRATRRIMDGLGETSRLPLFGIEEGDVGVLFGGPLLGVVIGSLVGLDAFVLPLSCAGLMCSVMIVYAAPRHLSAWTWLRNVARYILVRPRVTLGTPADTERASTQGGLVDRLPITLDERTQDLTAIERAWPGVGAVERSDGALQGYLELHPDTMDFAMSGDWAALQQTAATFANTEIEFPLRLYVTTRSFPVEILIDRLDDRLDDPSLEATPTLQRLIEEYREQRPAELDETQELHYYLGTEVDRFEVYTRDERERTPSEKLAAIPLVGLLFTPFVTRRTTYTESEIHDRMVDLLDRRLQTIDTEFVDQVPGWTTTRCSTLDLIGLAAQFWSGTSVEGLEYRREPAVDAERRGDAE